MKPLRIPVGISILLAGLAAASACWAAKDTFTATIVDYPYGEDFFQGIAINNSGAVVGVIFHPDIVYWYTGANGTGVFLPDPSRVVSLSGLNDPGQAVGTYRPVLGGPTHAFVTDAAGGIIDANPPGASASTGGAIDSQGRIVVQETVGGVSRAFISNKTRTTFRQLGTLGQDAIGRAVNNGLVVGWSTLASGATHGFATRANGTGMTDLGTFGGTESRAYGVNDRGQVVGYATDGAGDSCAFITGADGASLLKLSDLGNHPGLSAAGSVAYGVNHGGHVVGSARAAAAAGVLKGFISGKNGHGLHNINNFVTLPNGSWVTYAKAINDSGQIVAEDYLDEGKLWLLTPTRATWEDELEAE